MDGPNETDLFAKCLTTFNQWLDQHYQKTWNVYKRTQSVFAFIKTLIAHIPDKHFLMIQYYGFFANRIRTKCFDEIPLLIPKNNKNHYTPYAIRLLEIFGKNPLLCYGQIMTIVNATFAIPLYQLMQRHENKIYQLKSAYLL